MNKISVFIVDDHYMVIEGIRSLLQHETDLQLVGYAANGKCCMDSLKNIAPDIVLMDINLPDISGVDLCKTLRETYPSVFVLGLSTHNQFSFINKMMENGASGYLLKNASREELVEAIHSAIKGKLYLSTEVANTLKTVNDNNNNAPQLTRREKEILVLIAEGLTNNEIAAKLFLSTGTVDSHRKNLMQKLNFKNTALLVKWAVENKMV
jgi:DNA-binding NarL/FixJ family response regulator